jgi:hypothetical protein
MAPGGLLVIPKENFTIRSYIVNTFKVHFGYKNFFVDIIKTF